MVPESLKRMNMFIEGGSLLGVTEEVTPPEIGHKFTEYRGAGMPGAADMEQGWEKMMLGIKFLEYPAHVMSQLGKVGVDGTGLRFVGAYRADAPGSSYVSHEIIARGQPGKFNFGTIKEGERTELETEWPLTYFKWLRNNEPLIELDFINGIEMVGTTDLAADIRRILGIA